MPAASVQDVAPAPSGGAVIHPTLSAQRDCVPAAKDWADQCENCEEGAGRLPVPLKQRGITLSTWRLYRNRHKLRSEA
eukprot:4268677-Prymnesium_polylepis.1